MESLAENGAASPASHHDGRTPVPGRAAWGRLQGGAEDLIEALLKDLAYAARGLRKNLGFAAVATITIALGIGACTAIFSVVNAVLLRPLPYSDSRRLVVVWGELRARQVNDWPFSPPDFRDLQLQTTSFSDDVERLAMALRKQFPIKQTSGLHFRPVSMYDDVAGGVRPAIVALMGTVIFVLLIACANVANLLIGEGLKLGAVGIVLGLAGALAITRVMASLLVGVGATDPLTFGSIVVIFTIIAIAASWIPGHRASRLDPMNAIREE